MKSEQSTLRLKPLGIDTYNESILFVRKDCDVCRSEGFSVPARVRITLNNRKILATLNTIDDTLLAPGEASLSLCAWKNLHAKASDQITLTHPKPLQSLSFVHEKVYGKRLDADEIQHILADIVSGQYSDIHLATFLTACASNGLNHREITELTRAMVNVGEKLSWPEAIVVDKHCVGGLPGNRTTLIVVPIVAAFGLVMPKTSSRAITSPAGTADTMEVFAPVDLPIHKMRRVVEKESGCIIWGGAVDLSPADDILIRVENVMGLDSKGLLIASVLSKKIAAGSTHTLIDIPVGTTAKVRSIETGKKLSDLFIQIARDFGITVETLLTDGGQPVGRNIGPALEAHDIMAVLQNKTQAPKDLRARALMLAGKILEFSPEVKAGAGVKIATQLLDSGIAWQKFQAICEAQGGFRMPPIAPYKEVITAQLCGRISSINNRQIARLARLAGAPRDKAAGVTLHKPLRGMVDKGEPLLTIYAESKAALRYALALLEQTPEIIQIETYD